ncbi:MAG: MerR family transcriptional regulator [Sporichthyaceae bacterium]
MPTYRISQLAERSGVPATTLRYYESAGLLAAARAGSGYRVYDDEAVERLAFISSAKLLGLPLEEIRALLGVWELGECSAVRDQLLPLVQQRVLDADLRIAELTAFTTFLAGVLTRLTQPAPAGACGPGCGCVPHRDRGPIAIDFGRVTPPVPEEAWREAPVACSLLGDAPVACSLAGEELGERAREWRALVASAIGNDTIADGLRLRFAFDPNLAADIARLAATEQQCCPFFDFHLHLTPAAVVLTVRAPESAASLLADLFGDLG